MRWLFSFLFMTAAVSGISARDGNENVDSVVARLWLERAFDLLDKSDGNVEMTSQAGNAWKIAEEYISGTPDSLYMEARLLLAGYQTEGKDDSLIRKAYEKLLLSLERSGENEFGISDFRSRAVLWSSLALRLSEYRALVDRYDEWPLGEKNDPVLTYAAARAALYLGLDERAGELASRGEALAVSSTDLSELGRNYGPAMSAFRALLMASGDEKAFDEAEAASRRWTGITEALIPWILAGYFETDQITVLKRIMDESFHSLLNDFGWISAGVYNRTSASPGRDLALARNLRVDLSEEYEDFTGTLSADANYDGYPEEWIRLVNGRIKSRRIDSDQDGRSEWEFEYDNRGPLLINLGEGKLAIHYEKGAFPEILSVIAKNGKTTTTVSFNPGAFSWDPTEGNPTWGIPASPNWNVPEFWEAARTVTVEEAAPEGLVRARTVLSGGYPIFAEESGLSKDNHENHYWVRQLLYEDGLPVAARRSFKISSVNLEERIWELYERYENGKLVGLAWDPGMTGAPLYMKDWALERYFEIQAWNLDGDEWMDARRFLLPDGSESTLDLMITEARAEDLLPWEASDWAPWER